jgi:hypothetical protein
MPVAVASRYPMPNSNDLTASQLSEEEFGKLQEIHELINLMLHELPVGPQNAAQFYFAPALPISPYTHAYHSWKMSPF